MWITATEFKKDRLFRLKPEYENYHNYSLRSISPLEPFYLKSIKNGNGDRVVSLYNSNHGAFSMGDFSGYLFKDDVGMFDILDEGEVGIEEHNYLSILLQRLPYHN